jgi:polysaccharide export outer membrane protein
MITYLLSGFLSIAAAGASVPAQAGPEYVIGPRDVIAITIFNEETLSRPALTVDPQGTVDCPLIGRVKVGGLTARQVEEELVRRYSDGYLKQPSLTVTVKEFRNMTIWVMGQVRTPGNYDLKGDANLMAALAAAGGTTTDAGSYVIVTSAPGGAEATGPILPDDKQPAQPQTRIPREDIDTGRAARVRLKSGDTVYVPKAAVFYIVGQVRSPNSYVLSDGLTVLQALALAGGATDRAAKNRITIQRIVNGRKVEIKVKESDPVQPGDTIKVPTRFF